MTEAVIPNRPLPSEARDINKILANFDALAAVINGELDSGNLKPTAGITEGQLSATVKALLAAKVSGLTSTVHIANAEAKAGELFLAGKALTCTLPKPAVNDNVCVYNFTNPASKELVKVKVAAGAGEIGGDFLSVGTKEIVLAAGQHVTLFGLEPEQGWLIVAGEPRKEQKYEIKVRTKVEMEAGVEISSNRPAFVSLIAGAVQSVGGAGFAGPAFMVLAAQKIKGITALEYFQLIQ